MRKVLAALLLLLALGASAWLGLGRAPARPVASGPARRIVAASPALVECLHALGALDRVVGVSSFTTWPPEAKKLRDVGGALDPNLLVIEELAPDAILCQGSAGKNEALANLARSRGIRLEFFAIERIADVLATLERLGDLTGEKAAARREAERLTASLAALRARAKAARPRVLLTFGHTPGELREIDVAGRESFVVECLEAAGADSIFADFPRGYRTVSREAVLERRPDAIVELRTEPVAEAVHARLAQDWAEAFPDLPAARAGAVKLAVHDAALVPGPRLDQVVRALAAALGP